MGITAAFDALGQTVMPAVAAAAFPDTMNITGETTSAGTGGGRVKSAAGAVYSNVPVAYEPTQVNSRLVVGDRSVSLNEYILTFPTHHAGSRINIDPKAHKLVVNARTAPGDEPAKTFRIISIRDLQGVVFEAICEKEN